MQEYGIFVMNYISFMMKWFLEWVCKYLFYIVVDYFCRKSFLLKFIRCLNKGFYIFMKNSL